MKRRFVNPAGIIPVVALLAVFLPAAPAAAYLNALMEFDYNFSRTEENSSGSTRIYRSNDFLQRYFLTMNQDIYPTLTFKAGYVLEKDIQKTRSDALDTKTTFVRMSPSAELGFRNPFLGATVGYNEIEAKTEHQGGLTSTLEQENWTAYFGTVRREYRPTFNVLYSRSHAFDKEHAEMDTVTEQVLVNSRYQPVKEFEARYSGTWSESQDNLHAVETDSVVQSGRLTYNDTFLKNRARVYSIYDISASVSETEVTGAGTGEVQQKLLPFAGLSGSGPLGTDAPPETVTSDTLVSNPALIDGNTSAGTGIDIGYSATVTAPRNIGLDLGADTEVNTIFVSVDQMLPSSITSLFSWAVYTSSDTADLKNWTLWQTIAPSGASFGPFDAGFQLRFPNVTTRYIKVVVSPLGTPVPVPGIDVNHILVTEIQPVITTAIGAFSPGKNTLRNTNQRIEAGANLKITDYPNLWYDIYYWRSKSDLQDVSPWTLINGLTLNQRLNRVFSTSAMARRTDSKDKAGNRLRYDYGASLSATPLPSLFHSIRFTRQTEELNADQEVNDSTTKSDFVYFNNTATVYRGVSVNFSVSWGDTTADGQNTRSTAFTVGSTLVPHRTLTINLYHTSSESRTTGGQAANTDRDSNSASFAFTPTQTFYLFGSYVTTSASNSTGAALPDSRVQTYTASWSPLLSGDLWFTVTATQILSSGDQKETTVSPQIRWVFNSGATLEAGYQLLRKENPLMNTKTDSLFASLKIAI